MKKILVVDDMQVTLMIAENILSTKYKTVTASSGEEAVEVFRREKPDMVLSDLRMPGMSGFELQLTLQKESRATVPFMFMTADKTEEAEMKGFDNGAMDFVRKPLNPDLLLRRIGNIMQQLENIQALEENAAIDRLTGLLNKTAVEKKLRKMCQGARGALMLADLDGFKMVNDMYGPGTGDDLLIGFSDILRAAVRPIDIIGRVGGDEFAVFCQGLSSESGVAKKSEYINESLVEYAKDLLGAKMNVPLGVSIGCVFVPAEGTDFSELTQKADKALYSVKQNGKHGYHIFGEGHQNEEVPEEAQPADKIEEILFESNKKSGALQLPLEGFSSMYRFLRRTLSIHSKPHCVLMFSLSCGAGAGASLDEAADKFYEVLQSTLRRSDAVSRIDDTRFLALLTNTTFPEFTNAVDRIEQNWEKVEASEGTELSYEWSPLEP